MFNHYPFNGGLFSGNTFGFRLTDPPTQDTSLITTVARVEQGLSIPKVIMGGLGGNNGSEFALFKKSTSYDFQMWKSKPFLINAPFNIQTIQLTLSEDLSTDMVIVPVLSFDNDTTRVAGTVISEINYDLGTDRITLTPYNFANRVHGENNFILELHFRGTVLLGVIPPITIQLETEERK